MLKMHKVFFIALKYYYNSIARKNGEGKEMYSTTSILKS